jgi:hypothetical protein
MRHFQSGWLPPMFSLVHSLEPVVIWAECLISRASVANYSLVELLAVRLEDEALAVPIAVNVIDLQNSDVIKSTPRLGTFSSECANNLSSGDCHGVLTFLPSHLAHRSCARFRHSSCSRLGQHMARYWSSRTVDTAPKRFQLLRWLAQSYRFPHFWGISGLLVEWGRWHRYRPAQRQLTAFSPGSGQGSNHGLVHFGWYNFCR